MSDDLTTKDDRQKLEENAEDLDKDSVSNVQYSVLYIEDNPANMRLVVQIFGRRPHIKLLEACDAPTGLALAIKHQPDLILMDINLPGMDGYAALENLQQHAVTQAISVIAVSANAMQIDIDKGLAAGFDGYITKPLDMENFLSTVDAALKRSAD